MSTQPRIIFMGTPDFAVASLEAIHSVYPVSAVVTTPDRPQGRGLKVLPSPVKAAAERLGIPVVLQPASLREPEFREAVEKLAPDVIAVVAFRILPRSVYTLARLGAFNVHASLLPRYRGAAPINWAIINGEHETGATSFLLADSVDTGSILAIRTLSIPDGTTAGELHDSLMPIAAQLAADTCRALVEGTAQGHPQNDALATAAPKIFRNDCRILWHKHAREVRNFIHGMSPYPGAWTEMQGKTLKILRAELRENSALQPGEFVIANGQFRVGCQVGEVIIRELQPEGKKALSIDDYIRGYRGPEQGIMA